MAQFSVYENRNRATRKSYPYLLDIQSNLLGDLRTTVVIPLMPKRAAGEKVMSGLNPVVKVQDRQLVAMTQMLAGVDRAVLGKEVGQLTKHRAAFIGAVDFMLSGI